ncbi:MAG: GIY-YIG nuclease family protein [Pseudomonadota bacterium]|uniref:GIY-YIG nuclease family protein n=1 Tax=Marisediminitalea aggregata TaxID=634436 RepID=UPI0020CD4A4C|nr:GIY-YIG nuclease family protein [Marisediminitalea aggregata]MCP4236379.1 GIY-YIG nuclease family protein [Aestuariibacter sp.]MCP5011610.1 GIY-YIG nuclease family protein [Aestuariibacter sp.]MCP9477740.1 GIY-YIG nuclease family protein [Marisediminitalea aggregata]MEC8229066.1 GIY-YIG nuclease family protein [Pseudomonadota bacterium]
MSERYPAVYILSNFTRTVLYVGVTSNLPQRVYQHKMSMVSGFCTRYNVKDLVYYEMHEEMYAAITREKQLKRWRRSWKEKLITQKNPQWLDLYPLIVG